MRRPRQPEHGARPRARRILAVASAGGHWVQLQRLRPAFAGEHVTWMTTDPTCREDIGDDRLRVVRDASRWNRFGLLRLALQVGWIMLRARPHVVVSTGAAPGFFAVAFGKLLGARTVWIDSMANVREMSMSGRKIGRFADLWLTQWPDLATGEGPAFRGAVL